MGGEVLAVGNLREQKNFVPLPYRCVSFQPYRGEMTEQAIERHLSAREVYRRTDVIVLHNDAGEYAVAAVQREASEQLFTAVEKVEVLGLPEDCVYIRDPQTDAANRSALAKTARLHGVTSAQTAIVAGTFDHVNIIHRPDPLMIRVIEVVPPDPPKLFHMVEHVLSYADLPPIYPELEAIDLRALCRSAHPEAFLVPCRSGGLDDLGVPVYFLDERPAKRENWMLLGCERSLQFHRHYYGDEPPRLEMCPRQIARKDARPTLLKCCLLEYGIEAQDGNVTVPWGADLNMVEQALAEIARQAGNG
jgi:hypothetical protein